MFSVAPTVCKGRLDHETSCECVDVGSAGNALFEPIIESKRFLASAFSECRAQHSGVDMVRVNGRKERV